MKQYKALSILAPYGENIANGKKTLEIRKWKPDQLPLNDVVIIQNNIKLSEAITEDPDGKAVALVDIVKVESWRADQQHQACALFYEEGWLAWQITNIRKIYSKNKIKAARKIYEINCEIKLI